MKISYNWLKNYVSTDLDAEEISKILTSTGLEVEAFEKIETIRGGLEGVVIGEVLTCVEHPNSDHLHITTVNLGEGNPVQIVCGAPNVAAGQKVPVATVGCTLYPNGESEGFKIKAGKIRGEQSLGMICAEDELGIGTDHDGIMVLDPSAVPGTPAREYFKIEEDYMLEIGLTPNRADAMSHIGVARDLIAYLQSNGEAVKLQLPDVNSFKKDNDNLKIAVEVENSDACPLYTGVTISGVTVKPSPDWLQNRLRAIGLNPHNNIVDVTNFVMHELGQPLHAFDAAHIEGGKIVVRTCTEGTPFTTLDEQERKLSNADLMVCNAKEPMCIAGVFGGKDSGVSASTTAIFLESAYFNPVWVRKTAKRHGLSTDSSFRFERGTDPNIPTFALRRAALLIKEVAGGEISSDMITVGSTTAAPFAVELDIDRVHSMIGKEIGADKIEAILKGLEIDITSRNGNTLQLAVPAYRVDVRREIDVIEDILRVYGYNNIEIPTTVHSTLSYAPKMSHEKVINAISDFLSHGGFNEMMSNSLTKSFYYENLKCCPLSERVQILNPLSQDLNVMRGTLLFGLMEALQLNTNRKNGDIKAYETGNCYFFNEAACEKGGLAPYNEESHLAMIISGNKSVASWNEKQEKSDFFTLKGVIEKLLARLGLNLNDGVFESCDADIYSEAVSVKIRNKELLSIGIVSKLIRKTFDIKSDVYYMELNIDTLISIIKSNIVKVKELSKFPEVNRDLALLVDKGTSFSALRECVLKSDKKLIKSVSLFDVYEGDKLPDNKKSYAISITLEDTTQTMTDKVIDKTMKSVIYNLEKGLNATVRS